MPMAFFAAPPAIVAPPTTAATGATVRAAAPPVPTITPPPAVIIDVPAPPTIAVPRTCPARFTAESLLLGPLPGAVPQLRDAAIPLTTPSPKSAAAEATALAA